MVWDVHFTEEELADVKRRAAIAGAATVSAYLRDCALGRPMHPRPAVPEVNRTVWGELGKLAGNVNVLGKHVNAGNVLAGPATGDLFHLLRDVHGAVQSLRRALLTGE